MAGGGAATDAGESRGAAADGAGTAGTAAAAADAAAAAAARGAGAAAAARAAEEAADEGAAGEGASAEPCLAADETAARAAARAAEAAATAAFARAALSAAACACFSRCAARLWLLGLKRFDTKADDAAAPAGPPMRRAALPAPPPLPADAPVGVGMPPAGRERGVLATREAEVAPAAPYWETDRPIDAGAAIGLLAARGAPADAAVPAEPPLPKRDRPTPATAGAPDLATAAPALRTAAA